MRNNIQKILIWLGFSLCLIVILLCIMGSVLAAYFDVSEIGFLIFSIPFIIEALLLYRKTGRSHHGKLSKSFIHLFVFLFIVYLIAVNVSLVHNPISYAQAQPILAAIDAYKKEHGHYPLNLSELDLNNIDDSIHYEADRNSNYYKLVLKSGGLFARECRYWIYRVGPSRGQREQTCRSRNF